MEAELKKAKEDLYRGFPISEKEQEKIREWELKHDAEKHGLKTMEQRAMGHGCIGGSLTWCFTPTSIGTIGEVICSCGEKFTFRIYRKRFMIKIIEGNIVNAKTDFIIHQVNCQGEMNTGVAKALRDYDEGIYKHYRKFCEFCKFESEELLGTCDAYLLKDRGQIVLSLFAQNKYGYDGKQYTDLEAFRYGLRYISQHFGVWREKKWTRRKRSL